MAKNLTSLNIDNMKKYVQKICLSILNHLKYPLLKYIEPGYDKMDHPDYPTYEIESSLYRSNRLIGVQYDEKGRATRRFLMEFHNTPKEQADILIRQLKEHYEFIRDLQPKGAI